MSNRQASLTLRLIDRVTGPARAVSASLSAVNTTMNTVRSVTTGAVRAMDRTSRAVRDTATRTRRASGDMTGMGAAFGSALFFGGKRVYDFEKMLNKLQAVGDLTAKQRDIFKGYAQEINEQYPFVLKEITEGAFELMRAGVKFQGMLGALAPTLSASLATDVPLGRMADHLTNIAYSMRMPLDSVDDARQTITRVADSLAYAANNSNASVEQLANTWQYVGPAIAAAGGTVEEASVVMMNLANAGIKASKAGTGLRRIYSRLLAPRPKDIEAFKLYGGGVNLQDYITPGGDIDPKNLIEVLSREGVFSGVNFDSLRDDIAGIVGDDNLKRSPAKMRAEIIKAIAGQVGEITPTDRKMMAQALDEWLAISVKDIDLFGLVKAINENSPNPEKLLLEIFGTRHFVKMLGLLGTDMNKQLEDFLNGAAGAAERMRAIMMQGVVGRVAVFAAVIDQLVMTVANAGGALDDFIFGINKLTLGIKELTKTNPEIMRWTVIAMAALTGLSALGLVLSGLTTVFSIAIKSLFLFGSALAALTILNWDAITGFVDAFGVNFKQAFGPRAQKYIKDFERSIDGLMRKDNFKVSEMFGRRAGRDFGKWFAEAVRWLEGTTLKYRALADEFGRTISLIGDMFPSEKLMEIGNFGIVEKYLGYVDYAVDSSHQRLIRFNNSLKATIEGTKTFLKEYAAALGEADPVNRSPTIRAVSNFWENYVPELRWDEFIPKLELGEYVKKLRWPDLFDTMNIGAYVAEMIVETNAHFYSKLPSIDWAKFFRLDELKSWLQTTWDMIIDWYNSLPFTQETGAVDKAQRLGEMLYQQQNPDEAVGRPPSKYEVGAARYELDRYTKGMSAQQKTEIEAYVSALARGDQKAQDLRKRLMDLNMNVRPTIDTTSIDQTIAKAQRARSLLGSLGAVDRGNMQPFRTSGAPPFVTGARAGGGPVRRGHTYWVGERGPELFEAPANGNIVPNHQLGGTTFQVHNNINVSSSDPKTAAKLVAQEIERGLQRIQQRSIDGRPFHD